MAEDQIDISSSRPADGLRQVLSTPAFATHIDVYKLESHRALNAALLPLIAAWRRAEAGMQASNQLGWHSPRSLFLRKERPFLALFRQIDRALTIVTRRSWPEFDIGRNVGVREGWVNVNGKGAFNAVHEHDMFHFSGVYYVAVAADGAGKSGAIEFINPAGITPMPLPNDEYLLPPRMTILPRPGSLIIFPSYLRHWVYPNQEEAERVSIAFNVRLRPNR